MCLRVDFNKTIDDSKEYVFYKAYIGGSYSSSFLSPIIGAEMPKNGYLVAYITDFVYQFLGSKSNRPTKRMPTCGVKAYNRVADEYYDNDGNCLYSNVYSGIHAYTSEKIVKSDFPVTRGYKIFKVKVKGEHIIAFGKNDDVVFTRGQIVFED